MPTMTGLNFWEAAAIQQREKAAAKALRRNKPLKTRSPKDLQWFLGHGWKVLSHTQPSYGQGQYWLLIPDSH